MRHRLSRPAALLAAGLTLAAAALGAPSARPARAQSPFGAQIPAGSITVTGSAEVQAKPDLARIALGVQTQGRAAADTAHDNAQQTDALIRAVRAAGIGEADIQTSDFSIDPQYSDTSRRPNQPPTIVGYQASNTVTITVRDISHVGAVIDAAVGAGGNVANGITFDMNDATRAAAEDAALAKAVANARRKAVVIARAAGAGSLTLVAIQEGEAAPTVVRPMAMMARMDVSGGAPTPVEPGQMSVTAHVTAQFVSGVMASVPVSSAP